MEEQHLWLYSCSAQTPHPLFIGEGPLLHSKPESGLVSYLLGSSSQDPGLAFLQSTLWGAPVLHCEATQPWACSTHSSQIPSSCLPIHQKLHPTPDLCTSLRTPDIPQPISSSLWT